MNSNDIALATIEDSTGLQEFIEVLGEHALAAERDIALLRREPANRTLIGSLFRTLHSIKGDAGLCQVGLGVAVVHPLETLLARVRSGEVPFTGPLADIVLLTVDRLELAVERLAVGETLDGLQLEPLIEGLEDLATARQAAVVTRVARLIDAVTGGRSQATGAAVEQDASGNADAHDDGLRSQAADDLLFFLTLANQFEMRSPRFAGRTMRILRLALETNQMAGNPVDPVQLEAAVYLHDVGMMFLPESIWLRASSLTAAELRIMRAHPEHAAGLLARMRGWSAAAEMVAQHHETPDGRGYPGGLTGERISAGAKILAIVDAFEAVMLKNAERGRKRSLLRAIAEINACDRQFAPEWIEPFNQVIRQATESR